MSSSTSTATAALALLLLCGVVLTASASMIPVGPLLVHLVTNSNSVGPKCTTKNASGGFLDAGPLGMDTLGQVPMKNKSGLQSVYQELVGIKGTKFTFQIHIIGYDNADRHYYCNHYRRKANAYRVTTALTAPTTQMSMRNRIRNRLRMRNRLANANANANANAGTNVGAAGSGSGSTTTSTATIAASISGGILFVMGVAMYASWRWQQSQFDLMARQLFVLQQQQPSRTQQSEDSEIPKTQEYVRREFLREATSATTAFDG